jgi:hypothetical protein
MFSVCVESKTRETDIFVFYQPMQTNFRLDSNKFMASPFSFFELNNPSIIIFLSMVTPVAYSEFAMPFSFLDIPHLSYFWDYIRKWSWKFAIHTFLIHILPIASCSCRIRNYESYVSVSSIIFSTKAILSRTAFLKPLMWQLVNYIIFLVQRPCFATVQ